MTLGQIVHGLTCKTCRDLYVRDFMRWLRNEPPYTGPFVAGESMILLDQTLGSTGEIQDWKPLYWPMSPHPTAEHKP